MRDSDLGIRVWGSGFGFWVSRFGSWVCLVDVAVGDEDAHGVSRVDPCCHLVAVRMCVRESERVCERERESVCVRERDSVCLCVSGWCSDLGWGDTIPVFSDFISFLCCQ